MAGLPWIPLDVTFPTGPKAVALGVALQTPMAWAHVVRLWAYAAQHQADGRFMGPAAVATIEAGAGWNGSAGVLVEALSLPHIRLLDVLETGFYIHDWHEHCGAHADKREKDRLRMRRARSAKRARTVREPSANVRGEREKEKERETEKKTSLLPLAPSPAVSPPEPPLDESPVVAHLPCVGAGPKEYAVTEAAIAGLSDAHPGVDVPGEVRKARLWLDANPERRKTHKGMPKFLLAWMGRAQNDGRGRGATPRTVTVPASPSTSFTGGRREL